MPIALGSSSYPLLNVFWTMLWFFLWVAWIWTLVAVFIDIFRSRDLSGWGKAMWFLFVLVIPLLGVLVYLIARGDKMHNSSLRHHLEACACRPACHRRDPDDRRRGRPGHFHRVPRRSAARARFGARL